MADEESWWDEDVDEANGKIHRTVGNDGFTPTIKVNAKNMVSRVIPDIDYNTTLPSLHTKADEMEEEGATTIHDILNAWSTTRRMIVNDKPTISGNLTMDTCMDALESNMITTNKVLEILTIQFIIRVTCLLNSRKNEAGNECSRFSFY